MYVVVANNITNENHIMKFSHSLQPDVKWQKIYSQCKVQDSREKTDLEKDSEKANQRMSILFSLCLLDITRYCSVALEQSFNKAISTTHSCCSSFFPFVDGTENTLQPLRKAGTLRENPNGHETLTHSKSSKTSSKESM
jgi:hypothetical protein